jgi:hypothetical protein
MFFEVTIVWSLTIKILFKCEINLGVNLYHVFLGCKASQLGRVIKIFRRSLLPPPSGKKRNIEKKK